MQKKLRGLTLLLGLGLVAGCSSGTPSLVRIPPATPLTPLLATETNATSGNAVVTYDIAAFSISPSGTLSLIGRVPTGGTSPGSITIDANARYLYVLNTGSVPSGNNTPGGITGFTIASMAGKAPGAIAGFAIGTGGSLAAIPTNVTGLPPGSIGLAIR
ncbi:MAG: beta-propeller fold lactonase family protein [Candidatus Eremiobacteraeota bacterium]|nr:beta-propeller fold lactonase family protein [Candidatus Eremiobacteraeota bacterium]MBC5801857.1 beta-propeller fold lactonase family protein [Candidatus Eremiobacteraeota bacterium]MBC5820999.1 beta-propeller fold lactonase family protein [Candidatus Eremiobacteraeota bacterium]